MHFLQNTSRVSFGAWVFGLLFGLAIFFIGGVHAIALAIVAPVALFVFYLALKNDFEIPQLPTVVRVLIVVFLLAILGSFFVSFNFHQTLISLSWLLLACMAGVEAMSFIRREGGVRAFVWAVTIIATLAVLFGFYLYIIFPDYAYLRLLGPFFAHNPFAGFLLAPLAVLVPFTLVETKTKHRKLLTVLLVIVATAFVLTLSRGAFVAYIGAWGVVGVIALIQKNYRLQRRAGVWILGVFVIAGVLALGAYKTKMHFAPHDIAPATAQVAAAVGGDTAVTSRVAYMKIGVVMAVHHPFGVGFGSYKEAEPMYRTSPVYQTTDPHNLFVRLFAETGVVGGLAFLALSIIFVLFLVKSIARKGDDRLSPVTLGFVVGSLAILFHACIEADWYFPGNMFFAIVWFMVTYVLVARTVKTIHVDYARFLRVGYMLITVGIIIFGFCYYLSYSRGDDGLYFAEQGDFLASESSFIQAMRFDTWNSKVINDYVDMLVTKSLTPNGASKDLYEQELDLIDKGLHVTPEYSHLYDGRSYVDRLLKDDAQSERDAKRAIATDPTLDLSAYVFLCRLYLQAGRYDDAIGLADKAIAYYPVSLFHNPFWSTPEKDNLHTDVMMILGVKANALQANGAPDEARTTMDVLKTYFE